MLLAGFGKGQTVGVLYGQSSPMTGLVDNRYQAAGVFAERPLGKRFSLSTGLNYIWYNYTNNGPFTIGCFTPLDQPMITRWEQRERLLELPLDAGYWIAGGKAGSRLGLRLTAGTSFVCVLESKDITTLDNGQKTVRDKHRQGELPHALMLKAGLEAQVRLGCSAVTIGFQARQGPFNTTTPNEIGSGFAYLKTGLRIFKAGGSRK